MKPSTMSQLHFKLSETIPAEELEGIVETVRQWGFASVRPLFPRSTDKELASMYLADGEAQKVNQLLIRLKKITEVEFVEKSAARRLF